jgi:hypothetical protein
MGIKINTPSGTTHFGKRPNYPPAPKPHPLPKTK